MRASFSMENRDSPRASHLPRDPGPGPSWLRRGPPQGAAASWGPGLPPEAGLARGRRASSGAGAAAGPPACFCVRNLRSRPQPLCHWGCVSRPISIRARLSLPLGIARRFGRCNSAREQSICGIPGRIDRENPRAPWLQRPPRVPARDRSSAGTAPAGSLPAQFPAQAG